MKVTEGRGYVVRSGLDTPFLGWVSASRLDAVSPFRSAPWLALRNTAELARLLPGGMALLWDLPTPAQLHLPPEALTGLWNALGRLSGLTLHVREEACAELIDGPVQVWFHHSRPPAGAMGHAWRQGWVGWVPEAGAGWSLPGLGRADDVPDAAGLTGGCWGELVLPLGALKAMDPGEIAQTLAGLQAGLERNLSQRLSARAWPEAFPFQRRRIGWRIAVLGGREYQTASGSWDEAAGHLRDFAEGLAGRLKCPIQLGTCHDPDAASLLGHQAMRDGHPWRYSLALPPASPTFTPGLAADPRDAAPLESRAFFPAALAPLLAHPPVSMLRLPNIPQEDSAAAFLRGLDPLPAIRWLPPEVPPPGPFLHERPWAAASAFVPLMDVTQALQPGLFDALDLPDGD